MRASEPKMTTFVGECRFLVAVKCLHLVSDLPRRGFDYLDKFLTFHLFASLRTCSTPGTISVGFAHLALLSVATHFPARNGYRRARAPSVDSYH
mmetsp:Transcript_63512/g.113353  ORF Transcript_63512/g.113353 Transcript_63512/m.113353 type:complete len:94 (-) Transcript_63512:377-658(-)